MGEEIINLTKVIGATIEKQVQKLHDIWIKGLPQQHELLIILDGYESGTPSALIWSD